jgi:hypothetical protein
MIRQYCTCLSRQLPLIFLSCSAALLTRAATPNSAIPLHSGLYLVLRPQTSPESSSKQAYIVYWPEDSTWDDQAASSSVRRNRVTFMRRVVKIIPHVEPSPTSFCRYLTKLTDQIIALVSPAQAACFGWETGAHNKDNPSDQLDNDESRLFSFEVSESLEQEEVAVASPGFTVR